MTLYYYTSLTNVCVCVWQVLECNWDGLLKKVRAAQDLDHIISAHDTFLQQIMSQSLLDADGQVYLRLACEQWIIPTPLPPLSLPLSLLPAAVESSANDLQPHNLVQREAGRDAGHWPGRGGQT